MFRELNSVLQWSEVSLPKEKFILITDTLKSSGSFLLYNFLQMFLKGEHHVCFVAFDQNFGHYFNVAKKLVRFIEKNSKIFAYARVSSLAFVVGN
jgi:hypothetical protein